MLKIWNLLKIHIVILFIMWVQGHYFK